MCQSVTNLDQVTNGLGVRFIGDEEKIPLAILREVNLQLVFVLQGLTTKKPLKGFCITDRDILENCKKLATIADYSLWVVPEGSLKLKDIKRIIYN